jgi:hypothetical protein
MLQRLALSAALAFAVQPALAADASKEVATATTHAGLAAAAVDLKGVQTHLHHVINCLVGPSGAGFDATQANPCKDLGGGAIPDSSPDHQTGLASTLTMAKKALAETDLAKAKTDSTALQEALKKQSL